MSIITIITNFCKFTLTECIVRNHGFNCLFMFVRSPKYGIFGHRLSEVNTFEMKTFHTHLVFICKTFNSKANISMKPQILSFDFSGLRSYLWPGKVLCATVPNIRLAR